MQASLPTALRFFGFALARTVLILTLIAAVARCGGGGGGDSGPPPPPPSPVITSVSKTLIPASTTFSVSGSNLNYATSWLLGTITLSVVSASSTTVTLRAPASTTNGTLRFIDSSSNNVATTHTLQVYVPIIVSQLSPIAQVIGQSVTVTGTGLDAVTTVFPSNATFFDAPATITAKTATSLTFIVPTYAETGPLELKSAYEPSVVTSQALSITPRIWFSWLTRQFSGSNLNIILQGGNLDQVSSATMGGVQAVLSNQSASGLTLTVPSATRGPIVLSSTNQTSRNAGEVHTVIGGSTIFFGMSFGQVLDEEADNPQLRLTPRKPTSVRAFIGGASVGISSPVVTLTATRGAATLGTRTMTGPSTLPTTISRFDPSQSFNAVLPGSWVSPGVTVQISYTPSGSSVPLSITEQPLIGNDTNLNLVVVPIRIGSSTGSVRTTPFAVRELMAMAFPYPYANVNVTTRAPLPITGINNVFTTENLLTVLANLEATRILENPDAFYYGFIADAALQVGSSGGRVVGIAWINDPENPRQTWKLVAVGTDSMANPGPQDSLGVNWAQWQLTMVHELGHVHSRRHAPCGNAAEPDPNFPYSGGTIGPQPIIASFYTSDTVIGLLGGTNIFGSSMSMKDVMSYCAGGWFSDYNYYYVQRFAERYSGADNIAAAGLASASAIQGEQSFLVLSGEIDTRGVTFRPALLSPRVIGDANSGPTGYDIVIKTADNNEFVQNLTPYSTSEHPNSISFRVSIPADLKISQVQVRKFGIPLPPSTIVETSHDRSVGVSWHVDPAGLVVKWDSEVDPYLTVIRLNKQGTRTVLRLFAVGGEIRVPTEEFAGAGVQIQLSTILNARMLQIIAP